MLRTLTLILRKTVFVPALLGVGALLTLLVEVCTSDTPTIPMFWAIGGILAGIVLEWVRSEGPVDPPNVTRSPKGRRTHVVWVDDPPPWDRPTPRPDIFAISDQAWRELTEPHRRRD
ncbi:MAG: hypothetical protein UY95_C0015G0023 [Parcubacteria group bacterium GW2011_GWA2_56_7]|nr:MAG: hypothetical protein UY95_C0015G0023 [Parcubacteria group bacterium GW2011_GWA2_56_7]